MNLFGLMETSGTAMEAERLRAEVVAANMANAETTRTATGRPLPSPGAGLRRRPGRPQLSRFHDGGIQWRHGAGFSSSCARGRYGCRAGRAYFPQSFKILHRRSSAMIRGIPTPGRTVTFPIPTLIPSQRWWT